MVLVCAGSDKTVTAIVEATLVPQEFCAVTEILPFCPDVPVVSVTETVPCPEIINHPAGTVQLYEVAFGRAAMLYTCPVRDEHWSTVPEIAPGCAGTDIGIIARD
jgi:hypothetical protein